MKKWWILRILKGIVLVILLVHLLGFVIMHLWNFVVPDLFHGPVITFMQALALLVLTRILFGGFRGGWFGRCSYHGGGWKEKHYWRDRIEAKMAQMTPEEKEKFRQKMHSKCGHGWWHEPGDTPAAEK